MMLDRRWYLVLALCAVSAGFIGYRWYREITIYVPNPGQIFSQATVDAALTDGLAHPGRLLIPTGVFIQSVEFVSAHDVNITGFIWQRYRDDVPATVSRGFMFPEQVFSDSTVVNEHYRRKQSSEEVIGWYFDVTVRQPFDYSKYPLDTQDVWLRLWHQDFDRDVVLTPDLTSYDATGVRDVFGLDSDIVPGGWSIQDTFFSYRRMDYDTNFGIEDYVGQRDFPELYFTITLRRAFANAFVVALVPLIIVLVLLFAVLIMATPDKEKADAFGFNPSGAIGASSALLFVVMLAHIDLRSDFAASGLLYLEYFYLIAYAAVLGVSLNVYLISLEGTGWLLDVLRRDDNMLAKLVFWPAVFLFLAASTAYVITG